MNVYLSRASVCAGDDVDAPHNKTIYVSDGMPILDILSLVSDSGYLPLIAGGKATWSASSNVPIAVLAQQWIKPRPLLTLSNNLSPLDFESDVLKIHFNITRNKTLIRFTKLYRTSDSTRFNHAGRVEKTYRYFFSTLFFTFPSSTTKPICLGLASVGDINSRNVSITGAHTKASSQTFQQSSQLSPRYANCAAHRYAIYLKIRRFQPLNRRLSAKARRHILI